ncbi:P-loop containing nucleoside triphosphate hydrolase protein [Xylariomycetidae sp. FL0641]|nr:P-loop containing nucleoside triphosphate hydrolase protein [Xylariomycetidae sp. FL0641]
MAGLPDRQGIVSVGRSGPDSLSFGAQFIVGRGIMPYLRLELLVAQGRSSTVTKYKHLGTIKLYLCDANAAIRQFHYIEGSSTPHEMKTFANDRPGFDDLSVPGGCTILQLGVKKIFPSMEHDVVTKLETSVKAQVAELLDLVAYHECSTEETTFTLYMHGDQVNSQHGSFHHVLRAAKYAVHLGQKHHDFLAPWFARTSLRRLNLDTVLSHKAVLGHNAVPRVKALPATTHFWNREEQAVFMIYGAIENYAEELAELQKRAEHEFPIHYAAMPGFIGPDGNIRKIIVVVNEDKDKNAHKYLAPRDRPVTCKIKDISDSDEIELNAERTKAPIPGLDPMAICFLADMPVSVKSNAARIVKVLGLEPPTGNSNNHAWLAGKLRASSATCHFCETLTEKPFAEDIAGFDELFETTTAGDAKTVSRTMAQKLCTWATTLASDLKVGVEIESDDGKVKYGTLSDLFPGLKAVTEGTGTPGLQTSYSLLNDAQKKAARTIAMSDNPVVSIHGCFGSGKTKFGLFIQAAIESQQPKHKTLWVVPTNQMADNLPGRHRYEYDRVALKGQIVRVYSISKAITKIADDLVSARPRLEAQKHSLEAIFYQGYPNQYPVLEDMVDSLKYEPYMCTFTTRDLEMALRTIFGAILKRVQSVVTTPTVARDPLMRSNFCPDLVIMDEGSRFREITTWSTAAAYAKAKAFLIIGDPKQLPPFGGLAGRDLTYGAQLQTSLLARIVGRGVPTAELMVNHRQLADLADLPSRLTYHERIQSGSPEQWTSEALHVNEMFRKLISPKVPRRQNRVLLSVRGSEECKVGNSWTNDLHVRYVTKKVARMLIDPGFKGAAGRPGKIAILCFYDALRAEMIAAIYEAELGRHLKDDQGGKGVRLAIRTVDGSQGDEADIVFVVAARTKHIGFCGDPHRMNVSMTRSRLGEVWLFEPSCMENEDPSEEKWFMQAFYQDLVRVGAVVKTSLV